MRIRDENKEQSIREKAMEMIVEEGFDGLSMQKLAKAANVSPATIYIYFQNREDLLNQLYNDVQQTFSDVALEGFNSELSFEEGLWIQWKNRYEFAFKYPVHFKFHEQFRNSHMITHNGIKNSDFKKNMGLFMKNAIQRGELIEMEPELFWSIAYGPFYALLRFHLQQNPIMSHPFELSTEKMQTAFQLVLKALKK